jgi:TldD protein
VKDRAPVYVGPPDGLLSEVLRRALRQGGDFADVFIEHKVSLSLRLEDGKVEEALSGSDLGGSVRIVRGRSTRFGYVDSVEEADLLRLAEQLARSASSATAGSPAAPSFPLLLPGGGFVSTSGGPSNTPRGEQAGDERAARVAAAARWLRLADETARGLSGEVRQVAAVYGESLQRIWVADSSEASASDHRARTMLAITVMAQRGSLIQVGRETLTLRDEGTDFEEEAVVAAARQAAEKALVMLDARPAPGGRMAVVLANGFGGVLFHEACGHGLEADYILKKASVWEGRVGQQVAESHVFAYDDGTGPGMWGSSRVDDEGVPCQRTTVIEAGVLTGYLSDRLRAALLGLPLSGNGRRQDFRHLPYPRMTNTYFGPGLHRPQELIADTPYGLYAKSLSGGQVNPATGEFVFGVAEGYLIEKGRITGPVRGATLIGNGPEVLLNIDAIADDLEVKPGTCGKEGQLVPVGSGQPTLRIRELTVGGTNV